MHRSGLKPSFRCLCVLVCACVCLCVLVCACVCLCVLVLSHREHLSLVWHAQLLVAPAQRLACE
jgi:hypothetical protein